MYSGVDIFSGVEYSRVGLHMYSGVLSSGLILRGGLTLTVTWRGF